MKKTLLGLLIVSALLSAKVESAPVMIGVQVETAHTSWVMRQEKDGTLTQVSYGPKETDVDTTPPKIPLPPVYPAFGDGYVWEPALRVTHADGNTSTDLLLVSAETKNDANDQNVAETRAVLRDPAYPLTVTLCFRAYQAEDVIEQWTEIRHDEPGEIVLHNFASGSLNLPTQRAYLTSFHGDWADEMNPVEQLLTPGLKVVDSKLGVRADQFASPSFLLSPDAPAKEESGAVIAGSLEWSGSFQLAFEVRKQGTRALCGINPFASEYHLRAKETFATPKMIWSYSLNGKGLLSRQLHRWARRYALRDGDKVRDVMLNNWEATEMNFDEPRLVGLFDGAKQVGADLFLLDDGWFGNKYPRNRDDAGLGDWQVNAKKLPHGLSYLTDEAKKRGLRFGIWLEPEMVNPRSELFEAHPDWAIQQPKRKLDLSRDQLVLDLTRPETRDFTFGVVDDTLSQNPGISYVKWDCNRYLTQPGSPFLPPDRQSHLFIDYVRSLYDVMERVEAKHPNVEMMLCSGGGGRVDYGALRHFHEFWPSDNTDPVRRVSMQWGYSYFFPAIATSAHVTRWGNRPMKFALDVAMSARLGLDLDLDKNTPEETNLLTSAIALYKNKIRDVVQRGDLYRLEAPGEGTRVALNYVSSKQDRAVVFIYQTQAEAGEDTGKPVHPRGLAPNRSYLVREVNLPEGKTSVLPEDGKIMDGKTLMDAGLMSPLRQPQGSAVVLLDKVEWD